MRLRLAALSAVPIVVAGVAVAVPAAAHGGHGHGGGSHARPDHYRVAQGGLLRGNVLRNDSRDPTTVVDNTDPAHGSVTVQPDGSFDYTPAPGFRGTDTFTYTTSDAVHLYRTHLPPLATVGGVKITGGAYGSSFTPAPGRPGLFYGLTDRGPNVDGPNGTKIEPLPDFDPAIGLFRLVDGRADLLRAIPLRAGDGSGYNGHVNCVANTGETITDINGTTLPCSDNGYDSEGLVAMRDGSFWVSDEYGPLITHFDRNGRAIGRFSPFDGSLPHELANRVPNKGMEGLTVTPDGRTLVGIMQSALQQPDLTAKTKNVTTLRIVTVDLRSHATHEYLYLLDDPQTNSGAVSEITALSDHTFLVDERDGNVEPGAYKKLFKIDVSGVTDVGPSASVPGATYDAAKGGLLVGSSQQSIEQYVGKDDTAAAAAALAAVHITPVAKSLDLDLGRLLTELNPKGYFFGHDKVEGVAALDRGRELVISNDNDFGIDAITNSTPPFQLHAKTLPNGEQDDGEYLAVDTRRLDDPVQAATVTITVR